MYIMSMSATNPNPFPCLPVTKYVSHSQKLDLLLDTLEEKYGLKDAAKFTSKENAKESEDEDDDDEDSQLWEMAKCIKKYNATYRTTAKILRELQKEHRIMHKSTKDLDPATKTVSTSTTSCSSLEDGDELDLGEEDVKKCQVQKQHKIHTLPSVNTRGILKNNHSSYQKNNNKVSSSNANKPLCPEVMSQSKSASPETRKATSPPNKENGIQARVARCTVASAAKAKSKLPLPMTTRIPMKNYQAPKEVTFSKKSINMNRNRTPTTRINAKHPHQLNYNQTSTVTIQRPAAVSSRPRSKVSSRLSSPKNVKIADHLKLGNTGKIPEQSEIMSPFPKTSPNSKTNLELGTEYANLTDTDTKLDMLRDLLEHSKTVVMQLFNMDVENNNNIANVSQKSSVSKIPKQTPTSTVSAETLTNPEPVQDLNANKTFFEPQIKNIFGVPYIHGLSKTPRPTYLL